MVVLTVVCPMTFMTANRVRVQEPDRQKQTPLVPETFCHFQCKSNQASHCRILEELRQNEYEEQHAVLLDKFFLLMSLISD